MLQILIVNTERGHHHLEVQTDVIWPVSVGVFPFALHTGQLFLLEAVHSHTTAEKPKSWSLQRTSGLLPFSYIKSKILEALEHEMFSSHSLIHHLIPICHKLAAENCSIFLLSSTTCQGKMARVILQETQWPNHKTCISQQGSTATEVSPEVTPFLSSYLMLSYPV